VAREAEDRLGEIVAAEGSGGHEGLGPCGGIEALMTVR
jgi:hypothetical protein